VGVWEIQSAQSKWRSGVEVGVLRNTDKLLIGPVCCWMTTTMCSEIGSDQAVVTAVTTVGHQEDNKLFIVTSDSKGGTRRWEEKK
jgi:hypothetical protein